MSMAAWIKRSIFWGKDFFNGSKVRKHYKDIKKGLTNSTYGKQKQKEALQKLLKHASTYSEFYKQQKGSMLLSDFPVVNKNILNANHDKVAISYAFIPGQETKIIHAQKTSGSTGTPFCVFQDSQKRYRRIAELKYFGQDVGYKSHEKLGQCRIWTKWQSKSKKQSFWENIYPINVSKMDDDTLEQLCALVKKKKIVSLRAYASWYDKMLEYFESGKGNPGDFKSIKVAISSSEALNEQTRENMLKLVGFPIVECYANEEGGILGQQKREDKNYYLNHASYYFEFLKMDKDEPAEYGELARIVFTDLYNYAFPLIRYDTGDTGVLMHSGTSSNSSGWDYMSKLYGRRLDLVFNTKGEPLHPMNFARVLKNFSGIHQWQFIQKDEKEYILKLNAAKGLDLEVVLSELKCILGEDASIHIEKVLEIPVLASGKRKAVLCEWKH